MQGAAEFGKIPDQRSLRFWVMTVAAVSLAGGSGNHRRNACSVVSKGHCGVPVLNHGALVGPVLAQPSESVMKEEEQECFGFSFGEQHLFA